MNEALATQPGGEEKRRPVGPAACTRPCDSGRDQVLLGMKEVLTKAGGPSEATWRRGGHS